MMLVVEPTAARASTPRNFPTMMVADKVPDDKTVHSIVQLLKEISDHERNREHDQEFRDGARGHVQGLLLFLSLIHKCYHLLRAVRRT